MTDEDEIREPVRIAMRALNALCDLKPSEYERKWFYEALSVIPWLDQKIRYAVNEQNDTSTNETVLELSPDGRVENVGRQRYSTRARNEERQAVRAISCYWSIERRKATLKAQGERAYHRRAYEDEAKEAGITVDALRQLIRRFLPEAERRRALMESARRFAAERKN
jgi:hypothetical protein